MVKTESGCAGFRTSTRGEARARAPSSGRRALCGARDRRSFRQAPFSTDSPMGTVIPTSGSSSSSRTAFHCGAAPGRSSTRTRSSQPGIAQEQIRPGLNPTRRRSGSARDSRTRYRSGPASRLRDRTRAPASRATRAPAMRPGRRFRTRTSRSSRTSRTHTTSGSSSSTRRGRARTRRWHRRATWTTSPHGAASRTGPSRSWGTVSRASSPWSPSCARGWSARCS